MSVDSELGRSGSGARRSGATRSRPTARRLTTPAPTAPLPLIVAGSLGGVGAAVLAVVTVGVPVLTAWMLVPDGNQSLSQVLQVTGGAWLAGQALPVQVAGVTISLLPLGLGAISLLFLVLAARWAARASAVARSGEALAVAASGALGYGVAAALIAALSPVAGVPGTRAFATTALVSLIVMSLAAMHAAGLLPSAWAKVPAALADMCAGAVVGCLALVGLSAVALAASLVVHAPEIGALLSALHLDPGGALLITALSLGYLPTAIVWSAAYLLGPGVVVGETLSPLTQTPPTTLPGFPLLTAIPDQLPTIGLVLPVVTVAAGVAAGMLLRRRGYTGIRGLGASAGAAGLTGATWLLAAYAASGSLGTDRLARVGPGWSLAAAAAGTVLVGAALATVWPAGNLLVEDDRG